MWLSERSARKTDFSPGQTGTATIGGEQVGVYTQLEQRNVPMYAPGGYCWMPRAGDELLVLKCGDGGQEPCVVGTEMVKAPQMKAGEVYIKSEGGASIYLKENGEAVITGDVRLSGSLRVEGDVSISGTLSVNGKAYKPCGCV